MSFDVNDLAKWEFVFADPATQLAERPRGQGRRLQRAAVAQDPRHAPVQVEQGAHKLGGVILRAIECARARARSRGRRHPGPASWVGPLRLRRAGRQVPAHRLHPALPQVHEFFTGHPQVHMRHSDCREKGEERKDGGFVCGYALSRD